MKNFIRIAVAATVLATPAVAQSPAELTDPEIATSPMSPMRSTCVMATWHLPSPTIQMCANSPPAWSKTTTRSTNRLWHCLTNLAWLLQDNPLSQKLLDDAEAIIDEMSALRGDAFDLRYAENELAYHRAVVDLVGNQFIPNIENAEVKAFFETGLTIFEVHTEHAEMMVESLKAK